MSTLKRLVISVIPRSVRNSLRQWRNRRNLDKNYRYDVERFVAYGCPFRDFEQEGELLAYIRMLAHALEKGLALPDARRGFGEVKTRQLIDSIKLQLNRHGWHDELASSIVCLERYFEFNRDTLPAIQQLSVEFQRLHERLPGSDEPRAAPGGTMRVTRDEIWQRGRLDLRGFFESRYSIRQFSSERVDPGLIVQAVRMAQKTPSVCNRQSARVYAFDNDDLGKRILECQSGNRGFGHQADKVLVVTADLSQFLSIGERNQCWIDGGMFAMSLIYALHSLGLGSCCLNWSVESDADERLRDVAQIADSENVIMLLAVGHLPEAFPVACSARKDLKDVLRMRCGTDNAPDGSANPGRAAAELLTRQVN